MPKTLLILYAGTEPGSFQETPVRQNHVRNSSTGQTLNPCLHILGGTFSQWNSPQLPIILLLLQSPLALQNSSQAESRLEFQHWPNFEPLPTHPAGHPSLRNSSQLPIQFVAAVESTRPQATIQTFGSLSLGPGPLGPHCPLPSNLARTTGQQATSVLLLLRGDVSFRFTSRAQGSSHYSARLITALSVTFDYVSHLLIGQLSTVRDRKSSETTIHKFRLNQLRILCLT